MALTVSATGKLREEGEIIQAEKRMKDIAKGAAIFHKNRFLTNWETIKEKLGMSKKSNLIMGYEGKLAKRSTSKICVKYSEAKASKSKAIWEEMKNIWRGGPFPIFSYDFKKDKPFNINVPLHIIHKTKAALEKKSKRRQEFDVKIQTIKVKSLHGVAETASTMPSYNTMTRSFTDGSLTRSTSVSSLNMHLDVLRSKLKDLKIDITKISEVLDNMSFDDDETEA